MSKRDLPYRWVGPQETLEQPGSPAWSTSRDKRTCTLSYEGPYTLLYASQPAYGATLAWLPPALKVETVACVSHEAGVGSLVITLATLDGTGESPVKYTRGSEEVTKDIRTHPRYADVSGDFRAWDHEPDDKLRREFKWKGNDGEEYELDSGTLEYELAEKILKGRDSYMIGLPSITEERRTTTRPAASKIWVVDTPPAGSNAWGDDVVWVKVADDYDEDGSLFIHKRKWLGFDAIDGAVYS